VVAFEGSYRLTRSLLEPTSEIFELYRTPGEIMELLTMQVCSRPQQKIYKCVNKRNHHSPYST
ncbi:unnamed protein product, partial [Nesidiocoris tenuis]